MERVKRGGRKGGERVGEKKQVIGREKKRRRTGVWRMTANLVSGTL